MNLKNVKQKLEKVNRFYDYLDTNQEITSRIDRDALIASIRALYEACFEEESASAAEVAAPQVHRTAPSATTSKDTDNNKKRPKLVFNTSTTSTASENKPTRPEQKQEPVKQQPIVEKAVEKTVIKEVPKKQDLAPKVEPKAATKAETSSNDFNEDYDGLFLFKEATDLSQKLSATPLQDLNKALGLNEKFLYINELFGGDVAKFQAAIKVLNDEKNFDTARSYIESQLIETYHWMKKVKQPISKDFIKLIRRRYL
ncbi:MAG: hypothetical protein JKY03_11035 [Aureispira sp.]|nr:hypothetical protein [Aureispira sp.]